jgi:hypothetical protein
MESVNVKKVIQQNVTMTFEDFRRAYPHLVMGSHGWMDLYAPFELKASDYLQFAENDLAHGDVRDVVNAASNIKRALDCRADELLSFWGLYRLSKKRNFRFAHKLGVIKQVGIIAPNLLTKINKYRNAVEHDYARPDIEQLNDYFDVVAIFLQYTDTFLKYDFDHSEFVTEETTKLSLPDLGDIEGEVMIANFALDRGLGVITLDGGDNIMHTKFTISITANAQLDEYLGALSLWYELVP